MGAIQKILQLYENIQDDDEIKDEPDTPKEEPIKQSTYQPIIIRGSYFEEDEESDEKDEVDFDEANFFTDEKDNAKDEGNLGVFLYQAILSTIIAIVYTVSSTIVAPFSQNVLTTVKSVSSDDFSFSGSVYQSVGTFFTYINEQRPIELNAQFFGDLLDLDSDILVVEEIETDDFVEPIIEIVDIIEPVELVEEENQLPIDETLEQEAPEVTDSIDELESIQTNATIQELPVNVTLTPVIFAGDIVFPISDYYYVTSDFGFRVNPITKVDEFHTAYDLAADKGTNILAVLDGTVVESRLGNDLGNFVTLDHGNGLTSLYGHCYELLVKAGDTVKQGDVIATVGSTGTSTGNHLHFGMKMNGIYFDPSYIFDELNLIGVED